MLGGVIRGVGAVIKWSYYEAATIHGYTVARDREGSKTWRLRGTIVKADAFKMAQRPLVLVLKTATSEMRWPIVEVNLQGGTVVALLGQQPDTVPTIGRGNEPKGIDVAEWMGKGIPAAEWLKQRG